MDNILIYDWSGSVKVSQYGYEHNQVIAESLHNIVDFFLEKNIQVMIRKPKHLEDYDYVLCLDTKNFSQR